MPTIHRAFTMRGDKGVRLHRLRHLGRLRGLMRGRRRTRAARRPSLIPAGVMSCRAMRLRSRAGRSPRAHKLLHKLLHRWLWRHRLRLLGGCVAARSDRYRRRRMLVGPARRRPRRHTPGGRAPTVARAHKLRPRHRWLWRHRLRLPGGCVAARSDQYRRRRMLMEPARRQPRRHTPGGRAPTMARAHKLQLRHRWLRRHRCVR